MIKSEVCNCWPFPSITLLSVVPFSNISRPPTHLAANRRVDNLLPVYTTTRMPNVRE